MAIYIKTQGLTPYHKLPTFIGEREEYGTIELQAKPSIILAELRRSKWRVSKGHLHDI